MSSKVRTLVIHILPPETISLKIAEKCQKYAKLMYILRLLLQEIFFIEKLRQLEKKMLAVPHKQNKNVLLHMS